ncbi:MAG: prenyltransferase, partial [bacterium]
MMNDLKIWLRAVRAQFFTASVVPVILGTSVALHSSGQFNLFLFCLTLAGIIFAHAGTNLANDYYDHRSGNDFVNKSPTPFSGGSRVIQNGLISAKKILVAALVFFALATSIGLYLNHVCRGNLILILAFLGGFLGFFYTADPLKIGYRGIGELAVSFGFGPPLVLGSYYVQTQNLSWEPVWSSIPIGLLIGLVLYLNEFPDYEPDKTVGKKTLVV